MQMQSDSNERTCCESGGCWDLDVDGLRDVWFILAGGESGSGLLFVECAGCADGAGAGEPDGRFVPRRSCCCCCCSAASITSAANASEPSVNVFERCVCCALAVGDSCGCGTCCTLGVLC